jgi:ABC-2 type transport system ATP-binding protein
MAHLGAPSSRPGHTDGPAPSPTLGPAPAAEPAAGPGRGLAVDIRGLHLAYGPVRAVDGIDLAIAPGETVALLGQNGAGKSTTLDVVLGLARPDAGQVRLFGRTPADAVADGRIGAMLQTGLLVRDLTVRELLTMVAALYRAPLGVDDVLAMTGTADIADRRTQRLSGGQTQRARFAVAMIADPALLVLDEPTVALDPESRHGFWASMRAATAAGKTVLFATHYLDEADAFADRIVVMARGRIVADGPTTEIKARVGRRRVRATLPGVPLTDLGTLAGVATAERHGDTVVLGCPDSDAAVRALLARYPEARDLEVGGAALEDAFLELTSDGPDHGFREARS